MRSWMRSAPVALGLAVAMGSNLVLADEAPRTVVSRVTGVAADPKWEEEYAYSLGVQAYVFAFPWYYNQLLRWRWVTQPPPNDRTPSMPMSSFWHAQYLADASYRDGGSPNNDTLYSVAWVDVGREPVILSVPAIENRYYSFCLTGYDADNFAYVGTRATGTRAGNYAIVGPNWKGTLPEGVRALTTAPTRVVFVLGRTMVKGPGDLEAVHHLQSQYKLTPLSRWGKADDTPSDERNVWGPYAAKDDPLADWKTINRAMTEIPPPPGNETLLELFARIGVGPGQDLGKASEATQRGLVRALETGKRVVTGAATFQAGARTVDGWRYPADYLGRDGLHRDFLGRAGPVSLGGIAANEPVEAMYPNTRVDSAGEPLSGAHRYRLHFAKGGLPPVSAFWSLMAYGADFNLIANQIDRYSLGDRSGLKSDADGGVTIYIQKDPPGKELESNWLPVGDQDFTLVVRLYLPKPEALSGQWHLPPVRRAD